jgi:hypothetical protein
MRDDFVGTTKTKIACYLNGHCWYRNTLMTIEKKGNEWLLGFWVQLWSDFISFCKPF